MFVRAILIPETGILFERIDRSRVEEEVDKLREC